MRSSQPYGVKYEKAVECLTKDRETLFALRLLRLPRRALEISTLDKPNREHVRDPCPCCCDPVLAKHPPSSSIYAAIRNDFTRRKPDNRI